VARGKFDIACGDEQSEKTEEQFRHSSSRVPLQRRQGNAAPFRLKKFH
jgi:hypothetical protein